MVDSGWEHIKEGKEDFLLPECPPELKALLWNERPPILPLKIFLTFVTPQLLRAVWDTALEAGHQDNFAWSCILQNTYNAYMSINREDPADCTFENFFKDVADRLYDLALRTEE
eukprot:CAMPEP_0174956610 /NCGR_PEP_ID=MMETSP0004_2-20121128/1621_1 /TAXON_ID=420556 /ORGANISM="Ochromonas sp., Strain CCMP1393" /LENGTH=113 /DNA_ID=CAMNT_0016204645 /DNA_START=184 /DNA_END=526 /DNA_ORIENTATION=-